MMSRLWLNSLLIVTMVMFAQTSRVSSLDSSQDDSSTCGCSDDDGKQWRPDFHPVNNIQIGGNCCDSLGDLSSATDDLLNMTRKILDSLQNSRAPEPVTKNDCNPHTFPRDCSEVQANGVNTSGVYAIYPDGPGDPFFVSCDMDTDGGGWTVFQRRQDGSVDFFLYWSDYKYGFGSLSGEHWLGNDRIHRLTAQKTYELRVDLEDFEGQTRYAQYSSFIISNEAGNYVLTTGEYSGDADDNLSAHSSHPFSTRDRDNDDYADNCAALFDGAWWYTACHGSNLNGQYLAGTTTEYASGVTWSAWHGYYYSLKKTEMKIRPV